MLKHPTLLLVDDEQPILNTLKRLLEDEPIDVVTTTSPKEGLDLLERIEPAVVVSDLKMPEMDGLDFLKQVKALHPSTIRMVLTSYADIDNTLRAINDGEVFRFLTKPWEDEELLFLIQQAFEQYVFNRSNNNLTDQLDSVKKMNQRMLKQQIERLQKIYQLNQKIDNTREDVIKALSDLLKIHNRLVWNHAKSIHFVTKQFIKYLHLPKPEKEQIEAAALLSHIGKVGIPSEILRKNESFLTAEEQKIIKKSRHYGSFHCGAIRPIERSSSLYSLPAGTLRRHWLSRQTVW
jgi:response regulator RpfG family c-di-GMP phosphodiesterase